jgi:hypothetical protein
MHIKQFEDLIKFHTVRDRNGVTYSFPLVKVKLIQNGGRVISLSLLFDTGASTTSLRHDLHPLLGLASWDIGTPQQTETAGGDHLITAYRYEGITLEVFGKTLKCPVNLIKMPTNPLYCGLLGRETIFKEFGFGFWERTGEIYITLKP